MLRGREILQILVHIHVTSMTRVVQCTCTRNSAVICNCRIKVGINKNCVHCPLHITVGISRTQYNHSL